MKQKKYDDDDGRVIADMNIEGIRPRRFREDKQIRGTELYNEEKPTLQLTKHEERSVILSSLLAVLLVVAIFGGAAFLFILFCKYIWF